MNCRPQMAMAALAVVCLTFACRKDGPSSTGNGDRPVRKVRFELYTAEDFSGETEQITFTLHMANNVRTIFDSSLAPMKVEDIPDSAHRIVIEHAVPGNDSSALSVGFLYEIQHVGNSWYLDSFPAADSFKLVRYSFK